MSGYVPKPTVGRIRPEIEERLTELLARECICGFDWCLNDSPEHIANGPAYPNLGYWSRVIEAEREGKPRPKWRGQRISIKLPARFEASA